MPERHPLTDLTREGRFSATARKDANIRHSASLHPVSTELTLFRLPVTGVMKKFASVRATQQVAYLFL